jgi:hypothetical protein
LKRRQAKWGRDVLRQFVLNLMTSDYVNGRRGKSAPSHIDWFLQKDRFPLVAQGKYNDAPVQERPMTEDERRQLEQERYRAQEAARRAENRAIEEQIRAEVQACTDKITEITGEAPKYFRPPFIDVSREMYDNIDLTFICGSGCEDWVPTVSAKERARRTLANAKDGEIILLHDMKWNINTVEALKTIIPELKARGFEMVTVSELFGFPPPETGGELYVYDKENYRTKD